MNQKPWLKPYKRRFVPAEFQITDWDSLEPFYRKLESESITHVQSLEKWFQKRGELQAVVEQEQTIREVQMACDTNDEKKKKAYLDFVKHFHPKITEWQNKLNQKYYKNALRARLPKRKYGVLDREIATDIELFSPKNIPLEVKISELVQKQQEIAGNWTIHFDGQERTMQEMSTRLFSTDRAYRKQVWDGMVSRRLQDKEVLENIFDEMLRARHQSAIHLGLSDFREYCFKSKLRDYTSEDCLKLHDSIEKAVLPLAKKILSRRKEQLKLKSLKPWDLSVDTKSRAPLKPFTTVLELQDGVQQIFYKIDKKLGDRFHSIRSRMDLDSRKGKAPGGFQATYSEDRLPFIFANAAGVQRDVQTLLHESGHAFHALQSRDQKLYWYRRAPMEFCEVASMTQELLAIPYYDVFYPVKHEYERACAELLEYVVEGFPWIARVDAFQHWIYTHPRHTQAERSKEWLAVSERFDMGINWDGLDIDMKAREWHKQLHIFQVPFYYIEYAIAQMGALQIYRNYRKSSKTALKKYLDALALGGSRPVSELFKTAGIRFDFSLDLLTELMDMVASDLKL